MENIIILTLSAPLYYTPTIFYGLALIMEFLELNRGTMQIVSHNGFVEYKDGALRKSLLDFRFDGTIVNMTFNFDKVTSTDCFFFDNNIWMFLFSGIANSRPRQQTAYSRLFKDILSAKATIFINALILSEYINRGLRLSFNQWTDTEWGIPGRRRYRFTSCHQCQGLQRRLHNQLLLAQQPHPRHRRPGSLFGELRYKDTDDVMRGWHQRL